MAASLGAAIKAYLETKGLGIAFYRDAPPQNTPLPYGTIVEDIAMKMDPLEDGGPANGGTATGKELVQLDLWQNWLKADKTINEDPLLPDRITNAIHGSRLLTTGTGVSPKLIYHIGQESRVRILDRDSAIVHHAFTLAVHRVI